jgi:hypothetical protein
MVHELRNEQVRQQSRRRDPLVDDVRGHRCLHDLLAAPAHPLAANVALDREHAGLVIELLGHVLTDALHRLPAAAVGVRRLVRYVSVRQMRRQRRALGGLLLVLVLGLVVAIVALPLKLACEFAQVGLERLFQQALLFRCQGAGEALARGGELQPLEHGHLVRELVDQRLLERGFALALRDQGLLGAQLLIALGHFGHQRQQCLTHLLRIERVELLWGDHRS